MGLYFIISGTLAILVSFGVFEGVLKANNIKRLFASIFLIISCILSTFNKVNIFGAEISINIILYLFVTIVMFFKQKTIKSYISLILSGLLVISVLTFYNALNLSSFEFSTVQPYVYVAIFMGVVLNYVCTNFKSSFVGTFIGCLVFELLFYNLSLSFTAQNLTIGSDQTMLFTIVSAIAYCMFNYFVYLARSIKNRKKEQKVKV